MLIIGKDYVVLQPNNGRGRISLDVTLQIHIVLKSLSKSGMWDGDNWSKLHLQVDVSFVALANTVIGHTVIGATIFLLNRFYLEYVADVC